MAHKNLYFIYLAFCTIFISSVVAQDDIAIGEWRTHLPYDQVIDVAVAGDLVFAATPFSLFTYNTLDNRVGRFDKVQGLSDVGVSKIGYNKQMDALLIAYTNTNLDQVYSDGRIVNISDIKDKDILGNKTINNILFKNEFAYLSCGFGIVVLNMEREEIADTYYIGPGGSTINVLCMTYNDTSFIASTESGLYYADVNANNLADFNQWHKDESMIHPDLTYNFVQNFAGKIYTNYFNDGWDGDTLFVYDGNSWDYWQKDSYSRHHESVVSGDEMYLVNRHNVTIYNNLGIETGRIWTVDGESYQPLAMDKGDDINLWIGDQTKGLIKNWDTWNNEFIKPNGPSSKNVFHLDAAGKNVWVAPGGRQGNWAKIYNRDGVFSFIDNTWFTYNRKNTPALDSITDMVVAKVDPLNTNIAYIGSFQEGVLKFEDEALTTIYSQENSSLQPWVANPSLINVSGLDFDSDHNLWVANTGAPDIVSVMKNDGNWKSLNLGGSLSGIDVGYLMVDRYNQKWIIKRTDGYIIVYNDNGTIDNQSDDQVKVLNSATGNGAIPGSKVYSFASDLDGEVWVGSDKGICVFYSPDQIFEPGANWDAQQILVPRNDGSGLADILLETEVITAIAIDGANRKWIGTERAGVFYLSEDGVDQLAEFNTSNSPLLSNNITSITINSDGEVFFGTANGIISFRGTATPPPPSGSEIYAYPNPVRENYHGVIAIKGVPNNSSVKITDTYGNLVYETKSEGGQAIWDGYNFGGVKAVSGVYVVFVTNSDGSEEEATKILIIR